MSCCRNWGNCYLFRIDAGYRVRLADDFGELSGGDYGVQRFEGKELRLPERRAWWPGRENLATQHRGINW